MIRYKYIVFKLFLQIIEIIFKLSILKNIEKQFGSKDLFYI